MITSRAVPALLPAHIGVPHPDTGYVGSYADYLAERRAALAPMREQATEALSQAPNVASFLIELSDALDEAITSERHRD